MEVFHMLDFELLCLNIVRMLEVKLLFLNFFHILDEQLLSLRVFRGPIVSRLALCAGVLDTKVKTYLFGIAKYQIFNALKAKKKLYALPDETEDIETVVIEDEILTQEQKLLAKYFGQIGESCQEVLKMFYYRGLSIKEIVELSHYKDEHI